MYHIHTEDIWLDEANTVLISEKTPSGIISRLALDQSPPLYYFILHYWMKLLGQTEMALRALSALFGILLVISLFFIGQKLFATPTGIYAALISAIAPIQVMYSQQVRMYTLLPLTSLLSMFFLICFIQERHKTHIFWYVVSTVACLYTHNYAIFILPAQAMILFACTRHLKTVALWLLSIAGIVLSYLPWFWVLLSQFQTIPSSDWRSHFWDTYGFWESLFRTLKSFSPGGTQPPYVPLNALNWQPLLPVILSAILLVLGASPLMKRQHPSTPRRMAIFSLLSYATVPLLLAGLVSMISFPIYLAGRCDQLVFPAFCLLLALGITNVKPRALRYAIVIVLAIFSLKTLDDYYKKNLKYGDKVLASAISQRLKPGDAILCTSLTRASLEYYLRDKKSEIKFFSYPMENAAHLGHQNFAGLLNNPARLIREAQFLEKEIRNWAGETGHLFVVYVPNRVNEFLKQHIKKNTSSNQMRMIGWFKQSLIRVPIQLVMIDFKGGEARRGG